MDDESREERPEYTVAMPNRALISILVLGGIVGLIIWGLGLVLNRYVFDAFFCQNGISGQCAHVADYSAGLAVAIGSIAALIGLIYLRVYRPLLVVLASAISLWGVTQLAWDMEWYWGLVVSIALYLLAYGLYAWIARVRPFWIALAATVVVVVAVRLASTL